MGGGGGEEREERILLCVLIFIFGSEIILWRFVEKGSLWHNTTIHLVNCEEYFQKNEKDASPPPPNS